MNHIGQTTPLCPISYYRWEKYPDERSQLYEMNSYATQWERKDTEYNKIVKSVERNISKDSSLLLVEAVVRWLAQIVQVQNNKS